VIVGLRGDAEAIEHEARSLPGRPHILLQPRDRGSGAALMLGAYYIRRNAPDTTMAVIPSHGGGVPGSALVDALGEAARSVALQRAASVELGGARRPPPIAAAR
jgi:mannose-1-phosphate guanylyltransferase